ncbi:MAG: LuxR C-terminal-related transcriptional regulator [Dehalococcoidia bacterium]
MAIRLVFNPQMGWTGKAKSEALTYRELTILLMSAEGYNNKQIAQGLGIAYQTVKNNFHKLMQKLGAKTNAHALFLAMEAGFISIEWISDDMDESLALSQERRKEIRLYMMQEAEKISKMRKDEAERYMAEQNLKALDIRRRKKSSK